MKNEKHTLFSFASFALCTDPVTN